MHWELRECSQSPQKTIASSLFLPARLPGEAMHRGTSPAWISLATKDLWPGSWCCSAWGWGGTSGVSRGHAGTATPGGHRARSAHQPAWETVILKGSGAGKSQKGYKMGALFWPKPEANERTLVCCRHHGPAPELHHHRKKDLFHSSLCIWFWSNCFFICCIARTTSSTFECLV